MKTKKILIVGGAGFIGSHLAEKYVREGYLVKVFDDFSTGKWRNISELFNFKNFKLIKGDITKKELVQEAVKGIDIILHLAAQIHVDKSIIDPEHTFQTNIIGTLNILEAALQSDVELVVYASTSEVYGTAQQVPMNESHVLNPGSPYAASKVAADRMCFAYHNTYKLPVVIVRCFNTYGPRQADIGYAAVIPQFIRRVLQGFPPIIYGNGRQTRDYMYIKDAVQGYDLVLKSPEELLGKAINFGTGREVTILELAQSVIRLCGQEGHLKPVHGAERPGEVKRLCADIALARNQLHFKPKCTLQKGLGELIEWYKQGYEEWRAYT